MTANMTTTTVLISPAEKDPFDEAQMAAAAYLARYSGRTLETYRYDVRVFFQWCADVGLAVLEATRPHIELWRADMEQRGLAASTIDRRLSTISGSTDLPTSTDASPPTRLSTSAVQRSTRAK
jgi:integrase/recombinase XerD